MTSPLLRRGVDPIAEYLLPFEEIVVYRRLHWSVIIPSFAAGLGSLLVVGYITGQMTDRRGPLDDILWLGALWLTGRMIWQILEWDFVRFIVTTRRIMLVTGLANRRVAMMPLFRVTDMTYNQTVIGRIFGWGTFVVESAGQEQALRVVDRVPSPDVLYRTVCALMFDTEKTQEAPAETEEPTPHGDRNRTPRPDEGLDPLQEPF